MLTMKKMCRKMRNNWKMQFSKCILLKFYSYSDLHLTEILLWPFRSSIFPLIASNRTKFTEFIVCHKFIACHTYMISASHLTAIHYRYTGPIRRRGPLGLLADTDSHFLLAVAGDEWQQSGNGPEIALY